MTPDRALFIVLFSAGVLGVICLAMASGALTLYRRWEARKPIGK